MSQNQDRQTQEPRPASRLKRRWPLLVVAVAVVTVLIAAILTLRRPQAQTGHVVGAPVPSVEATDVAAPAAAGNADLSFAPEMVERAGLRYDVVRLQAVSNSLRTTGTVQPNAYRETRVTPLVGGRVTAVRVQLGDQVAKGQPLATIFSSELAEAQTKYLTVIADLKYRTAQYNRSLKLAELGAISQQEKEETEAHFQEHHAEHEAARQRLLLLGLTEAQIDRLKDGSQIRSEVNIPAPSAGVITARSVNVGQVVTMADSLFSVTDLSAVWVIANVYEKDFALLRAGTGVTITVPAYSGRTFRGTVSYVDPRVDPQTRTGQVRIEVANPGQMLKLGMFVDVALTAPGTQPTLVIPKAALQTVGADQIVFVPVGPGRFQMRKVQTAEAEGEVVRVTGGLSEGEKVVTEGSFFLRAEMGRSLPSHAH